MARKILITVVSLIISIVYAMAPAAAKSVVALVIGNSAYEHTAHLDNPQNDANDVADEFERLGFDVHRHIDLDHRGMRRAVRKFARALQGAKAGVFFYAGHGLQVSGTNYLVPIDAKLEEQTGIDFELIRFELIHRMMEQATKTNILFLDACRDNPLARSLSRSMGTRSAALSRGLARMESGVGSLISFSTQPGNVAVDGAGSRNSPYANALIKHLRNGERQIFDLLIKVRRDVIAATGGRQVPWEHSALTNEFNFRSRAIEPGPSKPKPVANLPVTPQEQTTRLPAPQNQAEVVFWNTVRSTKDPDLIRTYLDQYPNGTFAALARVMLGKFDERGNLKEQELPLLPDAHPMRGKRKVVKVTPAKKTTTRKIKKKTSRTNTTTKKKKSTRSSTQSRKTAKTTVRRSRKKRCRFETNFECVARGGTIKFGRCKDIREVCE